MASSKNPIIFYGAIVAAIVAVALCVYYFIPGPFHILVTHDPYAGHTTHAIGLAIVAVVSIIVALVTRPKSTSL